MTRNSISIATALGVAMVSWGCAQTPPAPFVPASPPLVAQCVTPMDGVRAGPALAGQAYGMQMSPLPINSVQFDSHSTASVLAIQRLYASRTPTGTLEVTARLVSCLDSPYVVRIRVSFLRRNEAPAETTSAWRELYLSPRAIATYAEYSTALDADLYLIEIAAGQ